MQKFALTCLLAWTGSGLAQPIAPAAGNATQAPEQAQDVKVNDGAGVVLFGKSGWLFYAPETEYADYAPVVRSIALVSEQLKRKHVKLLVTLSPIKARIYERYLPAPLPAKVENRYANVLAALGKAGVSTVDLNTPLLAQAKTSAYPLYYRLDSHWSNEGALLAAKPVAQAVARLTDLSALPSVNYKLSRETAPHAGDLALKLSAAQQAKFPAQPSTTVSITPDVPPSALLADAPPPGIVEVGASYSAVGNFVPAIAYYLHKDVLNMAVSAQGPWKGLGDYLTGESFAKSPPKVLIWEITERDIGWQPSQEWLDKTLKNNKAFKS